MLTLNLEPMGGDDIESTAIEMCAAAKRLKIATGVQFNDVSITALVGASPKVVVRKYHEAMKRDSTPRVVVVHAHEKP